MSRRDTVLRMLHTDNAPVPAAFFIHFDPAHHRGQAAVDRHLEFFEYTGMDVVKVQYEDRFPLRPEIETAADWGRLPVYGLDFYANQLEILERIIAASAGDALVIQTMYSPLMQACTTVGRDRLVAHVAADPEAVRAGMEIITESMLAFVHACIDLGVDGFYASTQGGDDALFGDSPAFEACVKPYDLALMEPMERACAFNILHVCDFHGRYESLHPFLDYPGHVVSVPLEVGAAAADLERVAADFGRPVMGGLDRHGVIVSGSEGEIEAEVERVIGAAPSRFFLGADCTLPADVSWDNIRTAVRAAHAAR